MNARQCLVSGHIYDETKGNPGHGIAPGTVWADVLEGCECPTCGASKAGFVMIAI